MGKLGFYFRGFRVTLAAFFMSDEDRLKHSKSLLNPSLPQLGPAAPSPW
jgi:hypothetical protein